MEDEKIIVTKSVHIIVSSLRKISKDPNAPADVRLKACIQLMKMESAVPTSTRPEGRPRKDKTPAPLFVTDDLSELDTLYKKIKTIPDPIVECPVNSPSSTETSKIPEETPSTDSPSGSPSPKIPSTP